MNGILRYELIESEMERLTNILEAMLFYHRRPLTIAELALATGEERIEIRDALDSLKQQCASRGLRLREKDGYFRLDVATRYRMLCFKLRRQTEEQSPSEKSEKSASPKARTSADAHNWLDGRTRDVADEWDEDTLSSIADLVDEIDEIDLIDDEEENGRSAHERITVEHEISALPDDDEAANPADANKRPTSSGIASISADRVPAPDDIPDDADLKSAVDEAIKRASALLEKVKAGKENKSAPSH
jgi:hypothetical protein